MRSFPPLTGMVAVCFDILGVLSPKPKNVSRAWLGQSRESIPLGASAIARFGADIGASPHYLGNGHHTDIEIARNVLQAYRRSGSVSHVDKGAGPRREMLRERSETRVYQLAAGNVGAPCGAQRGRSPRLLEWTSVAGW